MNTKTNYFKTCLFAIVLLLSGKGYAQVANDLCSTAQFLTATSDTSCNATTGTFAKAKQENPPNTCGAETSGAAYDNWYKFIAVATNQVIDVRTFPAQGGGGAAGGTGAVVILYDTCGGSVIACGNPQIIRFGPITIVQAGLTRVSAQNLSLGKEYSIRVYNFGDTLPQTGADAFEICVHSTPPAPANDICSSATSLTVNDSCVTTLATTNGANQEKTANPCNANAASASAFDVWFAFTAAQANEIITVTPNGNNTDLAPVIELYDSCNGNLVVCANPTIFPGFGAFPGQVVLKTNNLTVGQSYKIRVYHYGTNAALSGNFAVCVYNAPPPPPNDICANAVQLSVGDTCSGTAGTLNSANQESPAKTCSPDSASATAFDVWYTFTAAESRQLIDVSALAAGQGGVAASIELYDSCNSSIIECANPTIFPGFGAIPGTTNMDVSGLVVGNTYKIRVYHYGTAAANNGSFEICVYNAPPPPTNDDCASATQIVQADSAQACVSTVVETNNATPSSKANTCGTTDSDDDVWFSFTAKSTAIIAKASNKSGGLQNTPIGFALYANNCVGAQHPTCSNAAAGDSIYFDNLTVGTNYILRTFTSGTTARGIYNLCVFTPPAGLANDKCAGAIEIPAYDSLACVKVTNGSLLNAQQESAADSCAAAPSQTAFDVWYKFTATANAHSIEVTGQRVAAEIELYDGNAGTCGALNNCKDPNVVSFGGNTFAVPGTTKMKALNLVKGKEYFVRVYHYGNAAASNPNFTICVYRDTAATGIKNQELAKSLQVFPNPSKGKFALNFNATAVSLVAIFTTSGQLVFTQQYAQNSIVNEEIDLSTFAKGVYTLKITNTHETLSRKLILE